MNTEEISYSSLPVAKPWYEPHSSSPDMPPTQAEISRSYHQQWYRLAVDGMQFALRPDGLEFNELWPQPTENHPAVEQLMGRFMLTWCHRVDQESTATHIDAQSAQCSTLVARLGSKIQQVAVLGGASQWAEPAVLVECSREDALNIARALNQYVVVQWTSAGAVIVWVDQSQPDQVVPWRVSELELAPCPMSRGVEVSNHVPREGGPGTSRGHAVAAMWQVHSAHLHSLVDCAVHGGSDTLWHERGAAIALYPITPASRFGPMRFDRS